MELNDRKLRILQAIISDFIQSAEPVGSRTLSRKYDMGVSAATIRNEMSDLEEMGFLTHPHTSAGRVPSDKAYRLYVNHLMKHYEMPEDKKRLISERLKKNISELDRTIERAAELLSELTNLTSFAITPKPNDDKLKYINIVTVDDQTVVLMIVAESGKISNTTVRLNTTYTDDQLLIMSKVMTHEYRGHNISEILTNDIVRDFQSDMLSLGRLAGDIRPNFLYTLENMLNVDLYLEGLTNIFSIPEYNDLEKAKMFMEIVNQKKCFTDILVNRESGIIITIGDENTEVNMKDCSLITATYHINGKMIGKLGVIGPTRMKYNKITSIIEYMTNNLNDAFRLKEGDSEEYE